MFGPRSLSRALVAAPFIVGGIQALRSSQRLAPAAGDVADTLAEQVGLLADPETLVKVNAAVQIGGGVLLALGLAPRLTSIALAASLVPTTLEGHRFWEAKGDDRHQQMMQFAKNAGMLGGLIALALDTGGRPSVFWQGGRAAGQATEVIGDAAHSVADTVSGAVTTAYHALPGVDA